jgi:hypothetical protein
MAFCALQWHWQFGCLKQVSIYKEGFESLLQSLEKGDKSSFPSADTIMVGLFGGWVVLDSLFYSPLGPELTQSDALHVACRIRFL